MSDADTGRLCEKIASAARETQVLLDAHFDSGENLSEGFSSAGIRDGLAIVEEYLKYGEYRLALEHAIYMIIETEIEVPTAILENISEAGLTMRMSPDAWSRIRHTGGGDATPPKSGQG